MPNLTERLAKLIVTDNAILFIGESLRTGLDTQPALQQIADLLAAQIDYDRPDRSLAAVARDFEVVKGRRELIATLREELHKIQPGPDEVHQLLADTLQPHTKVLTTRFDRSLEDALDQFNKEYVPIVRDADVPFFDEAKITIIKMQGDLNQPESLVITEDDLDAFISRLPAISDVVRAFFATKTLIFLGYDLNNAQFKRFYRQITFNLSAYRREAYAIVPSPLDTIETRHWESKNVSILEREPKEFLEELARNVKTLAKTDIPEDPTSKILNTITRGKIPTRPYKSLNQYEISDAPIFPARSEESHRLSNRILAHRMTILYGESGSGKSSLIRAGATPRLAKQRAMVAMCEPARGEMLQDAIYKAVLEVGIKAGLPSSESGSLLATIREWQHLLNGPIVIVVDQFEQFFQVYDARDQAAQAAMLNELAKDRSLDLRLVFITREDFLGQFQSLEAVIPGILNIRFRLERLGREDARAAIVEPAQIFGITWEPDLIETMLNDLYDPAGGGVSPPQLQIICDYLFDEIMKRNEVSGRKQELRITKSLFDEIGGAQVILGDYLDRAVAAFPREQHPTVQQLLGALVSSSGVKQRLELETLTRISGESPENTENLLNTLADQRLIQRIETEIEKGMPRIEFELTHDYLVARISSWLGTDFWAAQNAREILRETLPKWQAENRILPSEDLAGLTDSADRLNLDADEIELAYASAVGAGKHIEFWSGKLPKEQQGNTLTRILHNKNEDVRIRAAKELAPTAGFGSAPGALVNLIFTDDSPNVREAASHSLAQPLVSPLNYESGYLEALKNLLSQALADITYSRMDTPTVQAVVDIRDARPEFQEYIPAHTQRKILRAVWSRRWRRHRADILSDTIQGFQGGFWGLGIGMGVFLGISSINGPLLLRFLFGVLFVGIATAGVLGSFAGAGAGLFQALFTYISDPGKPWQKWLWTTLAVSGFMAVGISLLGAASPGEMALERWLLAGVIIGVGLAGPALAPMNVKWPIRLAVSVIAGIIVFSLVSLSDLFFPGDLIWPVLMGAAGGAGYFWALIRDFG